MSNEILPRTLYVVATPIGNLSDISERAIKTLKDVDFIAAEDTRISIKLLSHFGIRKNVVSYFEHNKNKSGENILSRLENGESCALISDAGTPAISDPGEELVKLASQKGFKIVPIPGASAAITALCVSGIDSRRFIFEGFLPHEKKERSIILEDYINEKRTVVFYESPHQLLDTLDELYETLGDRELCIARELTKINEEIIYTTLSEAIAIYKEKQPRGEYVLIIGGRKTVLKDEFWYNLDEKQHIAFYEKQGLSRMDAIKAAAKDRGLPKNTLYKTLLD